MYPTIRTIHLCLGLLTLLFLLMYGVSGFQMAHSQWFNLEPTVTEMELTVSGSDAREVALHLMNRHDMRGDLRQVARTDSGFDLRITRPGTVYDISYTKIGSVAKVKTSTSGFLGTLNRIHHLGGLWHGYGPLNMWGIVVGLVSCGLLLLGATGLYMWFKLNEERKVGAVLLTVSLAFSLTLMFLIRTG